MQAELQQFLKASWNFTEDEFSAFVRFYELTLDNGSLSFLLKTFEEDPDGSGDTVEVDWELAFVGKPQHSRSDNLFSVSATLEVLDSEAIPALPPTSFGHFGDEGADDDDPTVESNVSDCRENVSVILDGLEEGALYVIEIAAAEAGPFAPYIYFALLTNEERATKHKRVSMSNWFGGAQPWLRVKLWRTAGNVIVDTVIARAAQPLPPVLAPPDLTLAGCTEITTQAQVYAGSSGSFAEGIQPLETYQTSNGFVIPYSYLEDPMVFTSRNYRPFIRKYVIRQFAWNGHWGTLSTELGQDTPVTATGPAGATIKWTRDGSVPTETTPAPIPYGGVANNAYVVHDAFAGILLARCFKDGCKSPLVMVCVDKLMYERNSFVSGILGNFVINSCDLPIVDAVTGLNVESGDSCNVIYGGICPFEDTVVDAARLAAAPSQSHNTTAHGAWLRVRQKTIKLSSYIGWPIHWVSTGYFEFFSSTWNTGVVSNGWSIAARNHNWVIMCKQEDSFLGIEKVPFSASLAGPAGGPGDADRATFQAILDVKILDILFNLFIPDMVCNADFDHFVYMDRFDIMRSPLHYEEPRDLRWLGSDDGIDLSTPIPDIPDDPDVPVPPANFFDQFETYYDGDATAMTLDFRTGTDWNAAWAVRNGAAGTYGWDLFEFYADGAVPDNSTHIDGDGYTYYSGGEGWEIGVIKEWVFKTPLEAAVYKDDLESYANGPTPLTMLGGTGWDATLDFPGWKTDNDLIGGSETFETYADGAFVGSNTGTNFVANENWRAT